MKTKLCPKSTGKQGKMNCAIISIKLQMVTNLLNDFKFWGQDLHADFFPLNSQRIRSKILCLSSSAICLDLLSSSRMHAFFSWIEVRTLMLR